MPKLLCLLHNEWVSRAVVSCLSSIAISHDSVGLAAASKVDHIYSGELSGPTVDAMRECNAAGPLMINIVKLFPTPDGQNFLAFGRVFSGTVRAGDTVRVLGENYTTSDEEDLAVRSISSISISQVRYSCFMRCHDASCLFSVRREVVSLSVISCTVQRSASRILFQFIS